ncbi:sugar transporter domain-containing protein [Trichoderma sp. SZMC 28014]
MPGILGIQAYQDNLGSPEPLVKHVITAMVPIASIVGALWSSYLSVTMTPKWAMVYVCFIWVFGCVVQVALPVNNDMMYIARGLVGAGAGAMSAMVPVYLAEVARWKTRGRAIGFYQFGIAWGISAQYLIQYAAMKRLKQHKSVSDRQEFALRLSYGIQLLSGVLFFFGLLVLPHSPRTFTSHGLLGSAIGMIADLHAKGDVNQPEVIAQSQEMTEEIRIEREKNPPAFRTLLRRPLARRLFLGMSIQAWSQLCGINVMMHDLVYVLAGTRAISPFAMATAQVLIYYACTVPGIYLVDKIGRRPALLSGSLVMMMCLMLTGILQQYNGKPTLAQSRNGPSWMMDGNGQVTAAMTAFSCIFVAAFALSWGSISWIYPAEIFPTDIRGRAVALCTAARWGCNVAVALALPHLWALKYHTYYIFGMFNALALMHMYYAAYETKRQTLEEMHEPFDSGLPPWKFRQYDSRIESLAYLIKNRQRERDALGTLAARGNGPVVANPLDQEGWPFTRESMEAQ